MTVPSPIKRHPALQPLSREHMSGLVQARNLRQAADSTAADRRGTLARFIAVWDGEISHHFEDEERMLAGLLCPASLTRLISEHRQIQLLVEQAIAQTETDSPDPSLLQQLGDLLHDHIRWEEREAFNEAEQAATPAELDDLTRDGAAIERDRPGARPRLHL